MSLIVNEDIKVKSNLLDTLFFDDFDNYNLEEDQCLICYKNINNPIILNCKHIFCYNCLLNSYKGKKCNYHTKSSRMCPYCRTPSNYLPLINGIKPLKGIHKEFYYKHKVNINYCLALLKTGKNKGNKCNCKCISGSDYCGRHKSLEQNNKVLNIT